MKRNGLCGSCPVAHKKVASLDESSVDGRGLVLKPLAGKLASKPGNIFVTELGPAATPGKLNALGVFRSKQQFVI